jgi:hypothetical protein
MEPGFAGSLLFSRSLNNKQNGVSLKGAACFDMCTHCGMITTMNTLSLHSYFVTFCICN